MDEKQQRREARRKRRIRNQVTAYIVLAVILLGAAGGAALWVKHITAVREEARQEAQDKIDEILASEPPVATPEPTPEATEPAPSQKLEELVNAGVEGMPLEDKVAGLFVVTPEAITGVSTAVRAGDGTREALAKYAVGGLIYFQKNIQSMEQLTEMLDNTELYSKYPLFLAVDDEGGSVSRLAAAGLSQKMPGAKEIGATGDTQQAYQTGLAIGASLAEAGFNLDFAPVADLANVENSVMEERSYGSDAGEVAGFVNAMAAGLREQKITACVKHFPGIGSSVEDTHNGMASTDRTAEQFRAEEFVVFAEAIQEGADMIMVSHMSAPSLTGNNEPGIFSESMVTGILREELGFQGVIITDALNMQAISEYYGSGEAAVMALKAGCDMLLMPEDFEEAYQAVLEAVQNGVISEERINDSLKRIYRIKYAGQIQE